MAAAVMCYTQRKAASRGERHVGGADGRRAGLLMVGYDTHAMQSTQEAGETPGMLSIRAS